MQVTINNNNDFALHHQKAQRFGMWMALGSITMMFAAFTSAYLVRKGAGNWVQFVIPSPFYTSTLLIFLSSISMYIAHTANQKSNKKFLKIGLLLTMLFGVGFFVSQYMGWVALRNSGVYLDGNVSGSFFYVITYAHAAHVISGIFFLFYAYIKSSVLFKNNSASFFYDNAHTQFRVRTDLLSMYWHFVGILWVYLFIFLSINHQI